MKKTVITISREFGSGGRSIGRMVAEKLGYRFYDQELLLEVAKESGLSQEIVEQYALMKELSSRFPGKAITVSPCVFPWHEAKVCRDDFAQILCTLAILSEDRELIDEVCAIVKDCGSCRSVFHV